MKLSFLHSKIDTSIISHSNAILLIKSFKSCIIDRTESMRLRTMKMKQIPVIPLKITMSLEDLMDRGMEIADFRSTGKKQKSFSCDLDELEMPDSF